MDTSPTSPIRPLISEFVEGKRLKFQDLAMVDGQKRAVVPTNPIFGAANLPIMIGHYVPARQDTPEGRQGSPLLECGGEPARCWRSYGAAPGAVPGRDQR